MALVSADAHLPTHGGLTPAALGCVAAEHYVAQRASCCALATVRSCIANIVFSPADTSHTNTRAEGVSPPWPAIVRDRTNRRNTSAAGNRIRTSDQLREPSAPRGANKRECNGNPHTHRRRSAHEWRSCLPMRICPPTAGLHPPLLVLCVSASQTSFFSPADIRTPTQERGGVSPPWPAIVRDRTNRRNTSAAGNRIRTSDQLREPSAPRGANKRERNGNPHTHTVGGLPTNGARVCRCAFAHPRRAYASRSW
jgi:hypothetical protein